MVSKRGERNIGSTRTRAAGGVWLRLAHHRAVHVALILLVGIAAYSNTFRSSFQFDDLDFIEDNPVIRSLDNFFESTAGYEYNPRRFIGFLTFALNYHFGGYDVVGYHVTNVVIHLTNAVLLYLLILLTFKVLAGRQKPQVPLSGEGGTGHAGLIALFSALLFAAHPIQTQAVSYIYQRLTSLATLFYLLSLDAYIAARLRRELSQEGTRRAFDPKEVALYILSLAAAVLSMKTKEIAFTLPVVIVVYEHVFFRSSFKKLLFALPLLLTLAIIPLSIMGVNKPLGELLSDLGSDTRVQTSMSRWDYLMTQMRVITTYIRLLFLPAGQNIDYDYPLYHSILAPPVFLSFLFLASLFATAVYLLRRPQQTGEPESGGRPDLAYRPVIGFGILWFFITLSVESSIIPIVDVIFEHRVYLPSSGAFMAITSLAFLSAEKVRTKFPKAVSSTIALLTVIVLALVGATINRNSVWRDPVSLWEDAARKSPNKGRVHHDLGRAYDVQHAPLKAFEQYRLAVQVQPDLARAHESLGISLVSFGAITAAQYELATALQLDPSLRDAQMFLNYISKQQHHSYPHEPVR